MHAYQTKCSSPLSFSFSPELRWKQCSVCQQMALCEQSIGATNVWIKAKLGVAKQVWRCEQCTPGREWD
ncbi:MAG: hypothetical protein JKY55_05830 [Aliivibrio sp.]|uniref:hypothetical protein n=1 Tax=Aliivibrio sp. TaxID=1872443 RepID=UPI001A5E5746|nr:hypothetical protein [Aliivibrio sp.]